MNFWSNVNRSGALLLLLWCLFSFFWRLGDLPVYTRGEAREGLVIWEMYRSGNWVLPIINDDYIPFKPPFFHWTGTLLSLVAGDVNELTIRLPSALFATVGVFLVYIVGARLWNAKAGLLAATVLATSPEWSVSATIAQVDLTLTVFISAALLLFYIAYRQRRFNNLISGALGLLLAIATLSKGPLGLVLSTVIIFVFLCCRKDFGFLRTSHLLSGAAAFVFAAGSWYVLAFWQGGSAFFVRQILEESFGTAGGDYGHHQPYYYYVPVFFLNLAPWSFFSPVIALYLYCRRRDLQTSHLLFPLVWFGVVFVFFTFALGKRGVYILPLYPAFALLFGAWWVNLEKEGTGSVRCYVRAVACLVGVATLAATALGAVFLLRNIPADGPGVLPLLKSNGLKEVLTQFGPGFVPAWICVALSSLASLLIFLGMARERWTWLFGGLTAVAMAATVVLKTTYYPVIARERTLKPFALRVGHNLDPRAVLAFYDEYDYGAIFYSHRRILNGPPTHQDPNRPLFLLLREEDWRRIREHNELRMVDISEGRGPAGKHRLVLARVIKTPIVDPRRRVE